MVTTRQRERRKVEEKPARNGTNTPLMAHMSDADKELLKQERESIVIWRKPITTLYYFVLESLALFTELLYKLWTYKRTVALSILSLALLVLLYYVDGTHQPYISAMEKNILWWSYWVGLGILSSVGLGTGLHTFLLYLGPHIASVTLAAFECMSVDFPTPPYPDEIICPGAQEASMSLWTIMSKVRVEAFMWGAGTALGELPPYFMARAARLSGHMDEEEEEIEELLNEQQYHKLSLLGRAKIAVHNMVKKVGFVGILLCASIPNPLFDLAGITCGHFLVPFWTFFGATLIGKAVIKMHIQKLFVIFTFSERHVEHVVSLIGNIPGVGKSLESPFKDYLIKQKAKLHVAPGTAVPSDPSFLSQIFEKLVLCMVVFFVVSILNSMAQHYHKRMTQDKQKKTSKD